MADTILLHDHGTWAKLVLNRPDKLNSFNDRMHAELQATLQTVEETGKRAVLLTGAGRGFCAGQDLSARDPKRMESPPDLGDTLTRLFNPLVTRIATLPIPVVCAVNGVAAGAGANVALACDIVLAAQSARFIQSFARVGLIPDAGGSWTLPRLLGPARAMALAMTAEPLDAQTAVDWGLIWRCLPDADLMAEAEALTERLSQGPTHGLAQIKTAIRSAPDHSLDRHLAFEADLQRGCGHSADYAEGVSAFLEKRAPRFTGEAP